MEAHWKEAIIDPQRGVILNDLPFEPGEAVEILIVSKSRLTFSETASLAGSVLTYQDPCEPVALEDWELGN
jgi:hypothetical protein